MINHVVLFKLKDFPAEEKIKVAEELKSSLEALKGKIEELKYIEVGISFDPEAKGYDLALLSYFKTIDDLEKYRIHPEHLKVLKRIGEITVSRAAVDYEF